MTSKLRSRWRTAEGRALAWRVREALATGQGLSRLGLAQIDGRLDLRGYEDPSEGPVELAVPVPGTGRAVHLNQRREPTVIAGSLESVDLTGAQLQSFMFKGVRAVDCLLDQSACRDALIAASTFQKCSFRGVNFTGADLGDYDWQQSRTIFEAVDFRGSRLVGVGSSNATFRTCQFADILIRKSDFSSSFIDCTFSGVIDEVEFLGPDTHGPDRPINEFRGIDMREATLRFVRFAEIDLAGVQLPSGDHIVIHHAGCVLRKAIERLQDTDVPARLGLRGLLKSKRDYLAGDIFLIHRLDGADSEADAVWNEAFLRGIEAECAGAAGAG